MRQRMKCCALPLRHIYIAATAIFSHTLTTGFLNLNGSTNSPLSHVILVSSELINHYSLLFLLLFIDPVPRIHSDWCHISLTVFMVISGLRSIRSEFALLIGFNSALTTMQAIIYRNVRNIVRVFHKESPLNSLAIQRSIIHQMAIKTPETSQQPDITIWVIKLSFFFCRRHWIHKPNINSFNFNSFGL